jgi:hypothetical protein
MPKNSKKICECKTSQQAQTGKESVLFIGTQFSILYTSVPAKKKNVNVKQVNRHRLGLGRETGQVKVRLINL